MKYCLNTYSFGHYEAPEELGIYGMIEKTAEFGFDAIEFCQRPWMMEADDDELRKIGEAARKAGLETLAICVGADFLNGEGNPLDQTVEYLCRMVDKAVCLGVSKMRHDVTYGVTGTHGIGYHVVLPRLAEGCRRVTEYAATKGIMTMTENHGHYSQDADRVAALIDAVDSPNFGALVDLGNFMCADEDPTLSVSRLAPYACHVHCKDFLYKTGNQIHPGDGWFCTRAGNYLRGTVVGHGEAGIFQSLGILKRKGYDSYLSLEFEGVEDNLVGIRMGLANMKRLWELA